MKTILVTGGNRGIGLEICKQLDELGYKVIMGSRDLDRGIKAAASFSKNIIIKQLDVTNDETINNLFEFIKSEFGKLDVLINNAGIGEKRSNKRCNLINDTKDFLEANIKGVRQLKESILPALRNAGIVSAPRNADTVAISEVKLIMDTNFYGVWRMIQVFIPLLQKSENGRIINMSSGMGELKSLTGFYPGYSLSKLSLNALTIMFSNLLKEKGISVNSVCPGWVKTKMGGHNAPRNVSEGADTAVWLATEMEITSGKFFRDRKEINW